MNPLFRIAQIVVLFLSTSASAETLSELLAKGSGGKYVEPRKEEIAIAEKVFHEVFSPTRSLPRISALGAEIGFEVLSVHGASEEFLFLREVDSDRRGRGMYVFRTRPTSQLVVEAPHASDDLHTGLLAELLFRETGAVAAAWNTVGRDELVEGTREQADLAHLPESVFVAFTRAFAAAYPGGILLQLHGFARSQRKSEAGARSDAILSNGTRSPPRWLSSTAERFQAKYGGKFLVYPRDVKELGATTNSQMKALREVGHTGFLHLEMCLELRQRLKANEETRRVFWSCLPDKRP